MKANVFICLYLLSSTLFLRHLDQDLDGVLKAASPDMDWQRVPFIIEALGKTKEDFVRMAQVSSKNALKASQMAAFQSWKSSLLADQTLYEANSLRPRLFRSTWRRFANMEHNNDSTPSLKLVPARQSREQALKRRDIVKKLELMFSGYLGLLFCVQWLPASWLP